VGPIFGRTLELAEFQNLTKKNIASIVAITGRRRIGKSRLTHEFSRRNQYYRFLSVTGLAPSPRVTSLNP
jgi:AAA+ ATPase superfamily predicted ATPase